MRADVDAVRRAFATEGLRCLTPDHLEAAFLGPPRLGNARFGAGSAPACVVRDSLLRPTRSWRDEAEGRLAGFFVPTRTVQADAIRSLHPLGLCVVYDNGGSLLLGNLSSVASEVVLSAGRAVLTDPSAAS